jgi:hypothetical protein
MEIHFGKLFITRKQSSSLFRKIKTHFSCVAEFSAGKQHCLCHAHAVAAAAVVEGLARTAGEVGTFGHRVLILQVFHVYVQKIGELNSARIKAFLA